MKYNDEWNTTSMNEKKKNFFKVQICLSHLWFGNFALHSCSKCVTWRSIFKKGSFFCYFMKPMFPFWKVSSCALDDLLYSSVIRWLLINWIIILIPITCCLSFSPRSHEFIPCNSMTLFRSCQQITLCWTSTTPIISVMPLWGLLSCHFYLQWIQGFLLTERNFEPFTNQ